jgi:diacylglycerol kinase (ATP)
MPPAVDTLVIWNPNAGRVEDSAEIKHQLASREDATLVTPDGTDDAIAKVRDACVNGARKVIAAGGDGTINSVINGIADFPEVELAVLPLGTANDWCASLGVPDDLNEALDLALNGTARALDVAELVTATQTMRFANIATGGNSHRVTETITTEQKQKWGAMCYLLNGLSVLGDLHSFDATILWDDGVSTSVPVWNLIVANGQTTGGRIRIAPKALLDDGLLDIVIIEEGTLIDVASIAGLYLFDEYLSSGKVNYKQAKSIEVRSNPPIKFSIDGDLVDDAPIRFRVVERGVKTIVGPDAFCVGSEIVSDNG